MRKWQRWLCVGLGLLLLVYVTAYLRLSRRGYAEARQYHMEGFYYLAPENSHRWRVGNTVCFCLFYPLNVADCCLGTGRPACVCEPLWSLSR